MAGDWGRLPVIGPRPPRRPSAARLPQSGVRRCSDSSPPPGAEAGTRGDRRCTGRRGAHVAGGPVGRPSGAGHDISWAWPEGEQRPQLDPGLPRWVPSAQSEQALHCSEILGD
ncbi:hypothetical protein NDU88_005061 [Pleurodeles waltl]|uniref:Uncharacterized protein n=1 Tax=Pleurodeles waltl TaxID=8319 RepID=A0AAV7VLP4_PLEWA|nr:hypothetical protein NDU88_005061 [Pleurodeles waltl]